MKALEDGLKGTLFSSCKIIREGVEILQVFQLQSQNKEWERCGDGGFRNTVKRFSFCSKRIFRSLKKTSMGNAVDRQAEIYSCTITATRKLNHLGEQYLKYFLGIIIDTCVQTKTIVCLIQRPPQFRRFPPAEFRSSSCGICGRQPSDNMLPCHRLSFVKS
jgi:hypothetical protein